MQDQIKESTKVSDEALATTMSKLTAAKHRIDREVARREQIQASLNELDEKLISEKRRLKEDHVNEVETLRKSWGEERRILLDALQRDCNLVFDERRTSSKLAASPRSVSADFELISKEYSPGIIETTTVDESAAIKGTTSVAPYSKIDQELRETEAFVQRLLLGNQQDED